MIGRELALAQDARHGRAYPVGDSGVRNPPRAAPPLARVGEREVTGRGMKWWVVLATATVLIGCDSPGPLKPPVAPPQPLLAPLVVNPADPLRIESGAKLTLRVPLAFPAGANALYLQNNQLVSDVVRVTSLHLVDQVSGEFTVKHFMPTASGSFVEAGSQPLPR